MAAHPKHVKALKFVRMAQGQLRHIEKMIEDQEYCIDISNQLLAVMSLIKKANLEVLKKHMETCVKDAISEGNVDEKIKELEIIMNQVLKGK